MQHWLAKNVEEVEELMNDIAPGPHKPSDKYL